MTKAKKMLLLAGSAGALAPIKQLIASLPESFSTPITIVLHLSLHAERVIEHGLTEISATKVRNIFDKQKIEAGNIYLAPGAYHTLIEQDFSFALSLDERVHSCQPSIDVLFSSAAQVYGTKLMAIIFSGANNDGSDGALAIQKMNGQVWVQNPLEAEFPQMPSSAIIKGSVDFVGTTNELCQRMLTSNGYV